MKASASVTAHPRQAPGDKASATTAVSALSPEELAAAH